MKSAVKGPPWASLATAAAPPRRSECEPDNHRGNGWTESQERRGKHTGGEVRGPNAEQECFEPIGGIIARQLETCQRVAEKRPVLSITAALGVPLEHVQHRNAGGKRGGIVIERVVSLEVLLTYAGRLGNASE